MYPAYSISSVVSILVIVAIWKIFEKANQPGWAVLIPFYNLYILLKVAGGPDWWFILMLIPLVNIIVYFIICLAIAVRFGEGIVFAIGLFFLPFIFYPLLAFSNAQYNIYDA